MVTPELIGYIRSKLAQGRTREEIRAELVKSGGWSDLDLSEAFRTVLPAQQGSASTTTSNPTPSVGPAKNITTSAHSKTKNSLKDVIEGLVLVALSVALVFSWSFYKPQIMSLWTSVKVNFQQIPLPSFGIKKVPSSEVVKEKNTVVKNCGTTIAPDLKNKATYDGNVALRCLGDSALRCQNAQVVLSNDLLPTSLQVVEGENNCSFKLSYPADSTITNVSGKKLAGQYISCPLNVVKAVDETKTPTAFNAPNSENLARYGSQIYFYGALGVFMENGTDEKKIKALGCSGGYISSVVEGYKKMQSN